MLSNRRVHRDSFRSTHQLEETVREYIDANNDHPVPFVWTKPAADILDSVKRFCLHISDSGN